MSVYPISERKKHTMKLNSRATNLRHLQDALAALSAAASDARLRAAQALPPGTPLPPSPRADRNVLGTARRAAEVGATTREIAAAALLPVDWAAGAAKYGAPGSSQQRVAR